MEIRIPLFSAPTFDKTIFAFNEGSGISRFLPSVSLSKNAFYISQWFGIGERIAAYIEWRPTRMPYAIQRILAMPDPVFPHSFEVHVPGTQK